MKQEVQIIEKIKTELIDNCDKRHRIVYGGRGKGASWSIARILLLESMSEPLFNVCVREVQQSIQHSVQKLLADTIKHFHWDWFYKVRKNDIRGKNGSLFIFNGLRDQNSDNVKSLEGADRCWVAEAQAISRQSIDVLRPTIRKENAVFWWDFNPRFSSDPVYIDYVRNTPENAKIVFVNHTDNPWFPKSLQEEMKADYMRDEVRARHIWEGELADANETFVCPAQLVERAQQNVIKRPLPAVAVVGADIAHQGGDEIIFYKQQSGKTIDTYVSRYQSSTVTKDDLELFAGRNSIINIDNGHLGAAVADMLEDDGYYVNRIKFGGRPKNTEHYEDVVTEMYFDFKDILPEIDIPNDEELAIQLYTRKYMYINGKRGYEVMKIESKDEFKTHTHSLHKSPDRADALVMTYYQPSSVQDLSAIAKGVNAYGGK